MQQTALEKSVLNRALTFTCALAAGWMLVMVLHCQQFPPPSVTGGPPTVRQLLQQHNVPLTKEGLLRALRSTDAAVRYLAAEKLAEDRAYDTAPIVKEIFEKEGVMEARVNIALALAQLGDVSGKEALRFTCSSEDLPVYIRTRAAGYLLDLGSESCLAAILGILPSGDQDSKLQCLSLLPSFHHMTQMQFRQVLDAVNTSLSDQSPTVRINATIALGNLHSKAAIPYLQTAIRQESDEQVRSAMQNALQRLQQIQRKGKD